MMLEKGIQAGIDIEVKHYVKTYNRYIGFARERKGTNFTPERIDEQSTLQKLL